MTDRFRNKYRIQSARMQGYDYGTHGLYFVTICTKDRINYFGEITAPVETRDCASRDKTGNLETENRMSLQKINLHQDETDNRPSLRKTVIGKIAFDFWNEIPKHYPFVELDEFVIMPNHIHGILLINRPEKNDWNENKFGTQSRNLGAIIRGFKSSVKRYANQNKIEFEWQTRFYDVIIRDEKELFAIRQYIIDNPAKWADDKLNPKNPKP